MADPQTMPKSPSLARIAIKSSDIASVRVVDTDLVIVSRSGQRFIVRDGALRAMMEPDFRVAFGDGELKASDLLKQVGSVRLDDISRAMVKSTSEESSAADLPAKPLQSSRDTAADNELVVEVLSQSKELVSLVRDYVNEQKLINEKISSTFEELNARLTQLQESRNAAEAAAASKTGFLAGLNPGWGALGALGALGAAGGKSSGGVTSGNPSTAVIFPVLDLMGSIVLGPIVPGNQLTVVAYDRTGRVLGIADSVEAGTGNFKISISGGYSGLIILKVNDDGQGLDYLDEGSASGKSLDTNDLRSLVVATGLGTQIAHINPLTELLAVKSGMSPGMVSFRGSSQAVLDISKSLASILELSSSGQLLSELEVIATIDGQGNANPNANAAGRLLDAISRVESANNYSTNAAIAKLAEKIQVTGTSASFADPSIARVEDLINRVLQTPPVVAGLRLSNDSGASDTDLITSIAGQSLIVTLSKALSSAQSISWKTTDSTAWNSALLGNGTAQYVFDNVVLAPGNKSFEFRITSVATGLSEALNFAAGVPASYSLRTAPPPAPVVTDLQFSVDSGTPSDLITNGAIQTIAGSVNMILGASDKLLGSVDGGASFQEILNRTPVSSMGKTTFLWSGVQLVTAASAPSPSLVFKVVDAAGISSSNSAASVYVLDDVNPVNSIGSIRLSNDTGQPDDFETGVQTQTITARLGSALLVDATNRETLFGSVDGGQTWTNLNASIINLNSGGRNLNWQNVDLLLGANRIMFKIVDAAGNDSGILGAQDYFLESPPAAPSLSLVADTGSSPSDGITRSGLFLVSDIAPGSSWQYSLDGGLTWMAGVGSGFSVADGTYAALTIQVRQVSASGLAGATDANLRSIVVDTRISTPAVRLSVDTDFNGATNADGISGNASVMVTGLEDGATWRYRIGSADWTTGVGSTFTLPVADPSGSFFAANGIFVEQTDKAGNTSSIGTNSTAFRIITYQPDQTITNLRISGDSGVSPSGHYFSAAPGAGDFVTNVQNQTITATLSAGLRSGEVLYGSVDSAQSWVGLNAKLSNGVNLVWDNATLSSNGRIMLKIANAAGLSGEVQAVTDVFLDTSAPSVALMSGTVLTVDGLSGAGSSVVLNNTPTHVISAELSRNLISSGTNAELLWASTDSGASWINVTSLLNGIRFFSWNMADTGHNLSSGTNSFMLKVTDVPGNSVVLGSQSYFLDTTAPTFSSVGAVNFQENTTGAVYNAQTSEGDTGMFYTLSGADASLFNLNNATGVMSFISSPNMEKPTDSDGNGVYSVTVRATDLAGNFSEQAVNVTVTDERLTSANVFSLWLSDGAGGSGPATTSGALQAKMSEILEQRQVVSADGTANQSNVNNILQQYINRVTGTDVVSKAEFDAGFTISGKAAAGAASTIRFYLDNDRTNGTNEIGTQLVHGTNGVTINYDNASGNYTVNFAAGSAALRQATHGTAGSGVHQLTVDTNGNGVRNTGEASRLFLVASGTAQTTDTGTALQNYSVQDTVTKNVFVYYYGDPDGTGVGAVTHLDFGDTATNTTLSSFWDRDGGMLNNDPDYFNTWVAQTTQVTTANTAMGAFFNLPARTWEFQMAYNNAYITQAAARDNAANHTSWNSNTSRLSSLEELMALFAANFSMSPVPGAIEALRNSMQFPGGEVDNRPPAWVGRWYTSDAPSMLGNFTLTMSTGTLADAETSNTPYFFPVVL